MYTVDTGALYVVYVTDPMDQEFIELLLAPFEL